MRGSLTTIILLLISPIQAAASIALMLLANPVRKKLLDEAMQDHAAEVFNRADVQNALAIVRRYPKDTKFRDIPNEQWFALCEARETLKRHAVLF